MGSRMIKNIPPQIIQKAAKRIYCLIPLVLVDASAPAASMQTVRRFKYKFSSCQIEYLIILNPWLVERPRPPSKEVCREEHQFLVALTS